MTIDQDAHDKLSAKEYALTYVALSSFIKRAEPGERAALARMDPDNLRSHQIAALARALLAAGLQPENWRTDTWMRWSLIVHGIALAGHDETMPFGKQLQLAGVSEGRLNRLLSARRDAFRQMLPAMLRLLASKGIPPNWCELGGLIIKESGRDAADRERAESIRLRIAGAYFAAQSRTEKTK